LLDLEVEPPEEPQPEIARTVSLGDILPNPKPQHASNWTNPRKKPEILSGIPMKKKRENSDMKKELIGKWVFRRRKKENKF
jgi:hypothetical protein